MAEFLSNIGSFFSNLISSPWLLLLDILDIAILSLMIYYVLKGHARRTVIERYHHSDCIIVYIATFEIDRHALYSE